MTPTSRWRAAALVATLGWGATVIAWGLSSPTATPTVPENPAVSAPRASARQAPTVRRRRAHPDVAALPDQPVRRLRAVRSPTQTADPPEIAQLRAQIRGEVLEELAQERDERDQARSEAHLSRLLDTVDAFAEAHDLSATTRDALETAMTDMHTRMEAFRPDGPPEPGGPSDEVLDGMEASLAVLEADASAAMDDPDLTAAFVDQMTPPSLRPPPDGPPGRPPGGP